MILNQWLNLVDGPCVRVLAYHQMESAPRANSIFSVIETEFEEQLIYIKENYRVITFKELLQLDKEPEKGSDYVIITFDDGYRNNYMDAVPILNKHNLKACFFLTTNFIDHVPGNNPHRTGGIWRSTGMTRSDVVALRDMGFEIGAHTVNYYKLLDIPLTQARREILESKEVLENLLGQEVPYFAYPGGKSKYHFNDDLKGIVAEKFEVCCTTDRGRNSLRRMNLLEIKRISVQNWWTSFFFARELEGTFDFARNLSPLSIKRSGSRK